MALETKTLVVVKTIKVKIKAENAVQIANYIGEKIRETDNDFAENYGVEELGEVEVSYETSVA